MFHKQENLHGDTTWSGAQAQEGTGNPEAVRRQYVATNSAPGEITPTSKFCSEKTIHFYFFPKIKIKY